MDLEVALVQWPGEGARREVLRSTGGLRVLLVDAAAAPPLDCDCLEDWVRVPVAEADLHARIEGLRRRGDRRPTAPPIFEDGVVRFGERWVPVPPVEARLIAPLVERYGRVVGRDVLTEHGWPGAEAHRNVLDVHVLRLRRRLAPLGLAIRTIRSRGYLLEQAA